MEEWVHIFGNGNFNEKLHCVVDNPNTEEAKTLINETNKLVLVTGGNVINTSVMVCKKIPELFALVHYCGLPGFLRQFISATWIISLQYT